MISPRIWLVGVAVCLSVCGRAEESPLARASTLAQDGAVALEEKNYPEALAKFSEAAELRPDVPRILFNLAAAQTASEQPEEAVATLERLVALGVNLPVDKAEEFEALRGRPEFEAVVKKLAANMRPKGNGEMAFSLRDVTGLIESIAWRETTGEFYFGDVNGRAVWVRNKDGVLRRLTPEGDELLGVFGLKIDEEKGALWAATSAVPEMRGYSSEMEGEAALVEIDLESGAIRRTVPVTRPANDPYTHVLGDLALASDGSVFLTDSRSPTIWRAAPDAETLEAVVESDDFVSLQGIVATSGGDVLYVADYARGLFRVDVSRRAVQRLNLPENVTLVGVDGLTELPGGELIAIQNGVRPNRVLKITLDDAGESVASVTVLEAAHLTMAEPSLGCIGPKGEFYFVGNAAWGRFEGNGGEPSAPRPVPIFKTKVE